MNRLSVNTSGHEQRPQGWETSDHEIELSVVIPVYNASQTIARVVDEVFFHLKDIPIEIVLVNDGSADSSERVCGDLVKRYGGQVVLVQLTRNFGEHNAVLAGLKQASGAYVAVLDDDGQNGASDVRRMLEHAKLNHLNVVYGRYVDRQHPFLRIVASRLNDGMASALLKKPRGLYLSSFKVMDRWMVEELCRYSGPMPYIDGLILRATSNVGQIDVAHRPRLAGQSGYTCAKLFGLWLNMVMGFSLAPLRASMFIGLVAAAMGGLALVTCLIELWTGASGAGVMLIAGAVMLAAGIQLLALGVAGEYAARLLLQQSGMQQSVARYVRRGESQSNGDAFDDSQIPRVQSARARAG